MIILSLVITVFVVLRSRPFNKRALLSIIWGLERVSVKTRIIRAKIIISVKDVCVWNTLSSLRCLTTINNGFDLLSNLRFFVFLFLHFLLSLIFVVSFSFTLSFHILVFFTFKLYFALSHALSLRNFCFILFILIKSLRLLFLLNANLVLLLEFVFWDKLTLRYIFFWRLQMIIMSF